MFEKDEPLNIGSGLRLVPAGNEAIVREHPQLFHYTTVAGFQGILESNSLWATDYKTLNDRTEVHNSRAVLKAILTPRIRQLLRVRQRVSKELRRRIREAGGLEDAAHTFTGQILSVMFSSAFEPNDEGAVQEPPISVPYVTSFCSHSRDDEYVHSNGLLSQWRGYGGDGGMCIVFDTAALLRLLADESMQFHWSYLRMDAVRYFEPEGGTEQPSREVLDLCDYIAESMLGELADSAKSPARSKPDMSSCAVGMVTAAAFSKHRGFREEREVRIVVCPVVPEQELTYVPEFKEALDAGRRLFPTVAMKPIKQTADFRKRPYVALFETLEMKLPISRVIVGPSRCQEEHHSLATRMLPRNARIRRSETPYIA